MCRSLAKILELKRAGMSTLPHAPSRAQFSGYNQDTSRVTSTPGPSVMRITGTPLLDNNLVNVVSASAWRTGS